MKLWDKGYDINKDIEKFTVGNDYILDQKLVKFDCLASIAHAKMLAKIGVLKSDELHKLIDGINEIMKLDSKDKFKILPEDEDCHTAIEKFLTEKYGDVGKKIHTARSRNDQVLTALRMYEKEELGIIRASLLEFKKALSSKKYGKVEIPGYTHMQKAMSTTIGKWLGSFASAVDDNLKLMDSVHEIINQSPLGSAAGFGVPVFELDNEMTAKELGFAKVIEPANYVQHSRSKFEGNILNLLTQIMFDLNKLATDLMLYSMTEFGFIELPKEFCTGSSIMPQKKNPDVLELIRGKYHVALGEEFKIKSMTSNLMSGYNRDIQLTKEPVMNSIDITKNSLKMMTLVIAGMKISKENCQKAMTKELYATEEAYKLVKDGMPFREAYKKLGKRYSK